MIAAACRAAYPLAFWQQLMPSGECFGPVGVKGVEICVVRGSFGEYWRLILNPECLGLQVCGRSDGRIVRVHEIDYIINFRI